MNQNVKKNLRKHERRSSDISDRSDRIGPLAATFFAHNLLRFLDFNIPSVRESRSAKEKRARNGYASNFRSFRHFPESKDLLKALLKLCRLPIAAG